MILGIALGVGVAVAIDLANASAARAFEYSTDSVTGSATHQISNSTYGVDEAIYPNLVKQFPDIPMTPVITDYAISPQLGSRPLQLVGIDLFSAGAFQKSLQSWSALPVDQMVEFLTRPGALFISRGMADSYGMSAGQQIVLTVEGKQQSAFIAGIFDPGDDTTRRAMDGTILADIATAQEITGRTGKIDRIDLILGPDKSAVTTQIEKELPAGTSLATVETRKGNIEQMTAAFQTNLTALSLLALVVGMFLIYNTMTFSVVQRRPFFGILRSLGFTRGELFFSIAVEAFILGAIGSILGIGLGLLLGQGTVKMVTQTINDIYFTTTVRDTGIPASSLIKGGILGILATVFSAVPPAWEAASVQPREALSRSVLEKKTWTFLIRTAAAGLALMLAGGGVFLLPSTSLTTGFGGTIFIVMGYAMLAALLMVFLIQLIQPVMGRVFGLLGRLAARDLLSSLSRVSVAVAALMIAVSVTIGVGVMINSFRLTVETWLKESLQGDIYVSAPNFLANQPGMAIDPQVLVILNQHQDITGVDLMRVINIETDSGYIQLSATDNRRIASERMWASRELPVDQIWSRMKQGGVILSEPLANRLRLPAHGAQITLNTASGEHTFPVLGVYYDYASSYGTVTLSLETYRSLWKDESVSAAAVRLPAGADADAITASLQKELSPLQSLLVRPNKTLRADVMEVFDRTFAITGSLQILAMIVAFIGILSSLSLIQLEKQRETGILRAIGLTARQLWSLVMMETGLIGATAGILSIPMGYILAVVLIYVINRRSFGWTLQLSLAPQPFLEALAVAMAAALLAGIWPAWKLGRMPAAKAVRYE
jgi:putative ABC transport system permease protein